MSTSRTVARMLTLVATVHLVACVPPVPPERPRPEPTPPIVEEDLKPAETVEIGITDLNDKRGTDGKTLTLTGTLVNRGTRTTREVAVHVEALDQDGAVVASADPDPSTQIIAPGSTATFSVVFESHPTIDHYHVEAVAR